MIPALQIPRNQFQEHVRPGIIQQTISQGLKDTISNYSGMYYYCLGLLLQPSSYAAQQGIDKIFPMKC
jgi:hypothetical protein